MKNLFFLIISGVFLFASCEDDVINYEGSVEFSFNLSPSSKSSGNTSVDSVAYMLISIRDVTGNIFYEKKKIAVFKFGETFISEPIALIAGSFSLTEFLLLDKENKVIYATPMEGSQLEHLVIDPLPIEFSVNKDQTVKVTPQVIASASINPIDFGYATFSFDIVKTLDFLISIFAFDIVSENFELTSADVRIMSGVDILFDKALKDSTNQIFIQERDEYYTITVEKADFKTVEKTFTKTELDEFKNTPLIILLFNSDVPEMGLLAYYPFNGNAQDFSGNNYHGTLLGPTFTTDRHGNPNKSVFFDGIDDFITIAHNDGYKPGFPVTMSYWYQTPDLVKLGVIYTTDGRSSGYSGMRVGIANTEFHMEYGDGDNGMNSWNRRSFYSDAHPIQNEWYHVVAIFIGENQFKMYVNNNLVGGNLSGSGDYLNYSTNGALFGKHFTGYSDHFFYGKIDDFRMYNRILSLDEINMLYKE